MNLVYELRLYDDTLFTFHFEDRGLEGQTVEILSVTEAQRHLLPLDMELTSEGVRHWLARRVIPKNRTFVGEILKSLNLSPGDTKGIIDVCKGLSLNDSYWIVPEGFTGPYAHYNLFNYAMDTDIANLDEYAKTRPPAYADRTFGLTFERICQEVMGKAQKEQLRRLIGFEFQKHPHINWSDERLKAIERHTQKRVRQLLALERDVPRRKQTLSAQ